MPHIPLLEGLPGTLGPMVFSPETTKPLSALAEALLTGPHMLTLAEREMIATYVSSESDCYYCQHCNGSIAAQHLDGSTAKYEFITRLKQDFESANLSARMKALLNIAERSGRAASRLRQPMSTGLVAKAPPTRKFTTPF
jgi:alkylhydroperoxidase family enzyme